LQGQGGVGRAAHGLDDGASPSLPLYTRLPPMNPT
jgi:hypothetical protein